MTGILLTIALLALATFTIRLTGVLVGQRLPTTGPWARGLNALPGCLIVALVTSSLMSGGPTEWIAAAAAALVAILTRSLPLTMATGIIVVLLLRNSAGLLP